MHCIDIILHREALVTAHTPICYNTLNNCYWKTYPQPWRYPQQLELAEQLISLVDNVLDIELCVLLIVCLPNPCMNGGTCVIDDVNYRCLCTECWAGSCCNETIGKNYILYDFYKHGNWLNILTSALWGRRKQLLNAFGLFCRDNLSLFLTYRPLNIRRHKWLAICDHL